MYGMWEFGERDWTWIDMPANPKKDQPVGGAALIQLAPDEFLVAGSDVRIRFGLEKPAAGDNVQFLDVEEGTCVALLGTNGAGKSTLLKALCGVVEADRGAVMFDGREITGRAAIEQCRQDQPKRGLKQHHEPDHQPRPGADQFDDQGSETHKTAGSLLLRAHRPAGMSVIPQGATSRRILKDEVLMVRHAQDALLTLRTNASHWSM